MSSVDVIFGQVELTESEGGVEYFTVINHGYGEIDLSVFLNAADRETGRPDDATAGIQIIGVVRLVPGQEASLRRHTGPRRRRRRPDGRHLRGR
jgi:hypothetical protein